MRLGIDIGGGSTGLGLAGGLSFAPTVAALLGGSDPAVAHPVGTVL